MPLIDTERVREQAFLGVPSSLSNICKVCPLTIKEIVEMGMDEYSKRLSLLLLQETDIYKMIENAGQKIEIDQIHVLSYLLNIADKDQRFFIELQTAFSTFIKEEMLFLPTINAVLVGPATEKRLITNENFADFQEILRIQNNRPVKERPPENESEIARKFRLKREARDAAKRKQQEKNGEKQSFVSLLEIADVYGIDYANKTLFAFYRLLSRYQRKEKWDSDRSLLMAGADSKKIKAEYWAQDPKKQ